MAYADDINRYDERYYRQQAPLASEFARASGRATEADYGNMQNIMNQYMNIAGAGSNPSGGGRRGGGGGGTGGKHKAFLVNYTDPFESYAGYKEFGKTGGYSEQDMANLRARGVSPIRAVYGNAEREVQRQRSLQGGYSPNAIAAQVKMAREQGQGMADAMQNVEGGIVEGRNAGRLAGYGGMAGIEGQRLGAQIDVGKFNAQMQAQAQSQNIAARRAASASSAAARQADMGNRLAALSGARSLYGTTPGMSQLFANQVSGAVDQGGSYNVNMAGRRAQAPQRPSSWDTFMNRAQQGAGIGQAVAGMFDRRR